MATDDSPTASGATNVLLNQRSLTAPFHRAAVGIQGDENPGKAIGFDANGVLGTISVSGSPRIVNALDHGLGESESAATNVAALNAAAIVAGAAGILHIPPGEYAINGTVTVLGSIQATGAVLTSSQTTGVALQIGDGTVMSEKCLFLPHVKHSTYVWATQVGVCVKHCFRCEFHVPLIQGFKQGLVIQGLGKGCFYNNFFIGHLYDNEHNLEFSADATGAVNENVFYGGLYDYPSTRGPELAGTRDIYIPVLANSVNNNRWIGAAFEADTPEFQVECCGYDNYWLYCRWETTAPVKPKVKYGGNASSNVIAYGNYADQIVFTQSATAGNRCALITALKQKITGTSGETGVGVLAYQNPTSGFPIITLHDAGSTIPHDIFAQTAATDYCASFSSRTTSFKARADAFPRLTIDHLTGSMLLGDGTVAPIIGLTTSIGQLNLIAGAAAVNIPVNSTSGRGLLIGSSASDNFPLRVQRSLDGTVTNDFNNPNTGTAASMSVKVQCGGSSSYGEIIQYAPLNGSFPGATRFRCFGVGGLVAYCDNGPFQVYTGGFNERLTVSNAGAIILTGATLAASVPATATSTGVKGSIAWDAGFIYVCTATNTWRRTAITSW